jgi:REP element-mobilizing transposase RayT
MPRLPRSFLPETGLYHVTARGVARCVIFVDDSDRLRWLTLLKLVAERERWSCLAWCLMPNHFHLLLACELERLSRGMHWLNGRYAQCFNARHARVGHLFQERFHSAVVHDDKHLEQAFDYVLDNPVRAGLCGDRSEWRWLGSEL